MAVFQVYRIFLLHASVLLVCIMGPAGLCGTLLLQQGVNPWLINLFLIVLFFLSVLFATRYSGAIYEIRLNSKQMEIH